MVPLKYFHLSTIRLFNTMYAWSGEKHLIFYCDDDLDDLEMVQETFKAIASKVEVVTFHKNAEFVSLLRSETFSLQPCLIILDMNMPVYSGMDVLQIIRTIERLKSVPVVLFTTSSHPSHIAAANELSANYLIKPVSAAGVEDLMGQLLAFCGLNEYGVPIDSRK